MGKINIGKDAQAWVVWNTMSIDYSDSKVEEIKEAFAKKYGIPAANVRVTVNYTNKKGESETVMNKVMIENIHDPKFHQELFVDLFKERGITDYDLDALIKIDNMINSAIDFESYEKGRRYELKWLKWSNFLSYGQDNYFDFTDLHGLVLLNGNPANQSGKSTFAYDLLHFLFFGKTSSGKANVLAKCFNNKLPQETELKVEGCITIDGIDYIIRRTLTRPKLGSKRRDVSQKVEYYRLADNGAQIELSDAECLNEENGAKTTKSIKEAIGNERDFDMVISANSDNLKQLITLKDTDRGRLLARWIGLLPVEDKDTKAREKWNKEISQNRYCSKYNKVALETDNEEYRGAIRELEASIKDKEGLIVNIEKDIEREGCIRDAYLSAKKPIDSTLTTVDVSTLNFEVENITREGLKTKAEIEQYEKRISEIGEINYSEEDYKSRYREKDSILESISGIKSEINSNRAHIKQLKDGEYCPVCKRKLDGVDNSGHIAEMEERNKQLIAKGTELNERKLAIEKEISEMDATRALYLEKNRLELNVSACKVKLDSFRWSLKEKKRLQKDIEANKATIEENSRLDALINLSAEKIRTCNLKRDEYRNEINGFRNTIEANKKQIKENEFIITRIGEEEKTEKDWKTYLMLIGKDGISKMVLRKVLPMVNSELKRLLVDICDFDVEVCINDKNDVEFYLITGDVRQDLSAGSGFEQTAAALALRVVLGSMSSLSKPPFILLDEILGGVAKENYDNFKELIDRISKNYSFILFITHEEQTKEWADMTITVTKGPDRISRISLKK